ncbi:methyltransferase [Streptoalloteichus hindustanus]|uniref:O-methyltransferase n=1 Tax=Streptoalloteichus hindustanus TaxID=2017 RepID=A0A1M4YZG3_STRHI|nr:methyltransferase [Streptoalloteichus hindustanus]SHF11095.1 O-methyltransferase [Streptoalloteichus hindustanus]
MSEKTPEATATGAHGDSDVFGQIMTHLFAGPLLRAALTLRLPDHLGDEPVTPDELARRVGADTSALNRLLRTLASIGFLRHVEDGRYTHSAVSELMRASEAGSLLGHGVTIDALWQAWSQVGPAVRTGEAPFRAVHGTDFYTYLSEHDPEQSAAFHAAMNHATTQNNDDVVNAVDLGSATLVVDVGGGRGGLLRDFLRRHNHLRGILFDTETVVGEVFAELRTGDLASRCEIVVGDARESVPAGDVYLLRFVLHNWDDESCVRILSRCAEAARPGARVFVVESLLSEDEVPPAATALMDMGMYVTFGSGERSAAEFRKLFDQAGLTYVGATPTSWLHVLEARLDA